MRMLRDKGRVPPVEYVLQRFDGTRFFAHVTTEQIGTGSYKSIVLYRSEA
jgi:hypothetical protein